MYYWKSTNAGANRIHTFVDEFLRLGYQVVIGCISDEDSTIVDGNLTVKRFRCLLDERGSAKNRLKKDLFFYKKCLREFSKKSRYLHFDTILGTSPDLIPCLACSKLKRKYHAKFIFDVRDLWPEVAIQMGSFGPHSPYAICFRMVSRKLYSSADRILLVSDGKMKLVGSYRKGRYKDKLVLLPNGFDTGMLVLKADDTISEKFNMPSTKNVIYLGTIGLAQKLHFFVDLSKHFENDKSLAFFLIGDGAGLQDVKDYANQLNPSSLHLIPRIDKPLVKGVLDRASIYVIPLSSSKLNDSIPSKLYEALAFGIPVLLLASGDSTLLVQRFEAGVVLKPESSQEEIDDGLSKILLNYEFFKTNAKKASEYIISNESRQVYAKKLGGIV